MPTDLDLIEAQMDGTTPYYLPALIREIRALRIRVEELEVEGERLRDRLTVERVERMGAWERSIG